MVWVRRRPTVRRRPVRRRMLRRARPLPVVGRPIRRFMPSVARFSEAYGESLIIPPASVSNGLFTCQFNKLVNYANYSALYDLYRIVGMKVTLLPKWSQADITHVDGGGTNISGMNLPIFYIAPNRNPTVSAPSGVADMLNEQGVRYFPLKGKRSFYISYPKGKTTVYSDVSAPIGTSTSVYPNRIQPWLSTGGSGGLDQTDIAHNGFRWSMDASTVPNGITLQVVTTMYFQLKELN